MWPCPPKKQAPVYCGSKAAIHIFTKSLRYQLEDRNISVFEVIPPLVDTAMTKGRERDKMAPEQLCREFIRKFKRNKYEIAIEKVTWLKLLRRLSPTLADRMLKDSSEKYPLSSPTLLHYV
ncbi:SDR family NAD(P)-dependent oxidoreductase [Fodinibius halophilus]|uniref:SDR family NAD(P)-dependent oxidoreductase n=1 Tax=Fodinibius halophilus TaxID=1736908 RepID=A0A6M1T7Z1_9BACT|nr:SDR family NAD(P)-dependent oxidoreductase [Fodinibius halophilus]